MEEIRTCPNCGKQFKTNHWKKRFCSTRCNDIFHNEAKKARLKAARGGDDRVCPTCGKEFETNVPRQIYCSEKCRSISYAQMRKAEKELSGIATEKTCPVCKKKFKPARVSSITCGAPECVKAWKGIRYRHYHKPKKEDIVVETVSKDCKHKDCVYRTGNNHLPTCDYILYEGKSRGCDISKCDKYVPGKRKGKFELTPSSFDNSDDYEYKSYKNWGI